MIEYLNVLGGTMYVDESKAKEYDALGYQRKSVESNTKPEEIAKPIMAEANATEETTKKSKVTRNKKK